MKRMKIRRQRLNRAAFTLMEVMLVLVIIVVIAGLGIRTLGGSFEKARVNTAKASLSTLSNSVKEYQIEIGNGNLPQSLEALVSQPSDVEAGAWFAKLDKLPMDPWNKPFEYEVTGTTFKIKSNGPDGVAGTADDISN
ncbi:MAG: type II secretion system protein GspG [Pirellula sp.]|jgi:general secretion pathway protein G|nr:type II secretion system protein GspG [Pirellula sp.]